MDNIRYYSYLAYGLILALAGISYGYWDRPLAQYFYQSSHPIAQLLTQLGYSSKYLITFFVLWAYWTWRGQTLWARRAGLLFSCILIPGLVCDMVKPLLSRARPIEWFTHDLYGFFPFQFSANFWSMPSGHTTTLLGLCLGLGFIWPRYKIPLLFIGISLATTRVVLTAHYLSDVLIAIVLTSLCCAALHKRYMILECKH